MKLFHVGAVLCCSALIQLQAAEKTWTGGGSDNLWSSGLNWNGTPPANNDNLTFATANRQNNSNDVAGLTVGRVSFNSDGFILGGSSLTINGVAPAFCTNSSGTNIFALPIVTGSSLAGKFWFIAPNSELQISGPLTNTAATGTSIGWLALTNGGVLRILNEAKSTRGMDLFQGTVIVDGNAALVDAANDGIRFKPPTGSMAAIVLTNNGTIRIGGGGNFRMGHNGTGIGGIAGVGSVSRMDMSSGTLELYGPAVNIFVGDLVGGATAIFNQNGGLVLGSGGSGNVLTIGNSVNADGTYNLNGGMLWIAQVKQGNANATNAVFNFNGGVLKPTGDSITFFEGLLQANVQSGGAIIDTTNFNITVGQSLGGVGALTKLGSGALTLSGNNTYAGTTVISNGTLVVSGQISGSVNIVAGTLSGTGSIAGAVTVQASGSLAPGSGVGTLNLQGDLTLGGNVFLEVDKSLAATNDFVQAKGSLANSGATLFITNRGPNYSAGDLFKFFSKPMANGDAVQIFPASPGQGFAWTNKLALDGSIGIVPAQIVATPADLVGLTLSAGTLSPAFNSNVLSYMTSAAYSNSAVTLTATSANAGATIRLICNGETNFTTSGNASSIPLKTGTNVIDVQIAAPDNSVTKDYIVTFIRVPPNVIVILADDQGFSDWSCYGSEIPTPNLDRLASEGLRFRQFYNCARCSPTRCALLTGLYTAQVAVDPSQALPNLRNDNNVTIAELLGSNGYRTYMSGKWHLGNGALLPESRGFQQVFRYVNGTDHSEDTWDTNRYKFISSNGEMTNRTYSLGTFYQPDAIGDYAIDFINNDLVTHTNDKPFFLYMAFGSAHFPIQAPLDWVNTNVPVYSAGWDVVRNNRYTNILARGVLDSRSVLSPNEGTAPWNGIPAEVIPDWNSMASDRQADLARRMAIYAAMVQKMDSNIGRVVEELRAAGQLDNTLIFCVSDNGGNYEGAVFGQTGGVPNATPLTGSSLTNMGLAGEPVIYLGGGWAHVSDTPFRLFKHFDHEGGIRTPMIVHWPQGLTRTNEWVNEPGHVIDIMATIVDATGVGYPSQFNGHSVLPLEGQTLKPLFTATNEVSRTLGFEHEGNRAWISGGWKFVTKNFTAVVGSTPANQLELYDLSKDPTELTNVANAQPILLGSMVTNWNDWATRVGMPSSRLVNPSQLFTPVVPPQTSADLFVDTFNRPDNTNIDASMTGAWGSRVPPIGPDAAYYEGYEGSGLPTSIEVLSSNLQMAVGLGMAENGLMHNFVGQEIVDAGGFSVELTVQEINTDSSDSSNRYVGFGVGLTQAESAAGGDAGDNSGIIFRGKQGNANLGVSDFFVELDLNGNVKVWANGVLLDTVPVGQNYGTLTASYALTGFSTNDTVTVNVFFNGRQVDINSGNPNSMSRTFRWSHNNSNYIGLSARASNYAQMDNLAIRKLPLANGLAINYAMLHGLSGANASPAADPDGDGVNNFAEWAFGGDPMAVDPFIASLRSASLTATQDFQFTYQRLMNAANYGLRYRYFISADLTNWVETAPTQVNSQSNEDFPAYEVVTVQLPSTAIAGKEKLFLRVEAESVN